MRKKRRLGSKFWIRIWKTPKVGEVGLRFGQFVILSSVSGISFPKFPKTRGVEEGEDLDLKFLGFGPSLVLVINENAWTAQSIL